MICRTRCIADSNIRSARNASRDFWPTRWGSRGWRGRRRINCMIDPLARSSHWPRNVFLCSKTFMPTLQFESLRKILPAIRDRATALDRAGDWPYEDLRALAAIGADRWFIPPEFGGEGIDPLELHLRYEAI